MIYTMGMIALCASWLLPGHYFPWMAFQQDVLAALGAALVALAAIVSTDLKRYAVPRIAIVCFALAGVPMLQWLGGMIPFLGDALLCTLFLVAFAMCVVAAKSMTDAQGDNLQMALIAAVLVGAIASTGIGLVQWLQLGDFSQIEFLPAGGRVYANITQPNSLASLLALGIVGLLWLYETRRIGGACLTFAATFLGFGLVMTQSRTGWIFVLGLALWTLLMRHRLALQTSGRAVAGALALFVVATLLWQPLNLLLDQSLVEATSQRVSSAGTRPMNWLTLLDALWRAPWLGYGWFQVSVAQQVAVLDHPAQHEWLTYSHNGLIDLLIYNGIPIGLALCAAIAWWVSSRFQRCRDVNSWALLAGVGALLIHAMLEFPLAYAYFLLPLGLMIGIIESRYVGPPPRKAVFAIPRPVFALLLATVLGMLTWIWIEYLQIEDAARRVRLKEAGYIANGEAPSVPDVRLLDNQREFLWFRLTPAREGMTTQELDMMRTVSQRFAPPAAMLRYALAAGLNGREAEASRTLEVLCHMWTPTNCAEGRDAWKSAQEKYPKLRMIAYPASPDDPTAAVTH